MSDELPTYADAAQWLPTDVREAVEASLPCPVGGDHQWHESPRAEFHVWGRDEPIQVIERWRCACGLVRTTKP